MTDAVTDISTPADPKLVRVPTRADNRGYLSVLQARDLGFTPVRLYYSFDIRGERGGHAHKTLSSCMICAHGSLTVRLENARGIHEFVLDDPSWAVLVPPGCWRTITPNQAGSVLVVLASKDYDEDDYIRDYDRFGEWLAEQRGTPEVPYLALDRCHRLLRAPIDAAMTAVIEGNSLIGGPALTRFETAFADYCGVRHFVGCANGLDALSLILQAMGIGPGDEVVVPANSFIASALAVSERGATPVFVDVDPDTLLMEPGRVEAALTPRTRAIMPVHLFGVPVDMGPLLDLAERHGLKVIEDAAQAHGARWQGRRCGSLGHAAAFSFYPTKNLGALGDAGGVVTDDPDLAERIRLLGNYGSAAKYHHVVAGRNSRLDPIQAAVLEVKLRQLDGWNERRRTLAALYFDGLSGLDGLVLPRVPAGVEPVWHVFPVRIGGGRRDAVQAALRAGGIGTNIHYPTPIHRQPAYEALAVPSLPVAEAAAAETLSLPLDPYHTEAEISRVVAALRNILTPA